MKRTFFIILLLIAGLSQAQDCSCGRTIPWPPPEPGQTGPAEFKPSFTASFSNGKGVILCGFGIEPKNQEDFYAGEFAVYDCDNNNLNLGFYSAVEYCRISFKDEILAITEIKDLAIGPNWQREDVDFKTRYFYVKDDILVVSDSISLPSVQIDSKRIDEFYSFIKDPMNIDFKDEGLGIETQEGYAEILLKLEALAISGDPKAERLLRNFPEIFGFDPELCCGLGERYSSALYILDSMQAFPKASKTRQ